MTQLLIALALICQNHHGGVTLGGDNIAPKQQKKCVADLYACIQPTLLMPKEEGQTRVIDCLRKKGR